MATDAHRHAEQLTTQAEREASRGEERAANSLLLRAAAYEMEAFRSTAADRRLTRSALGMSAVALTRRGGEQDAALLLAYQVLADAALTDETRSELRMLVDEIETAKVTGGSLQRDGYTWSLRGGRIGYGMARVDVVGRVIDQIQRYSWRVYEMVAGKEFRTVTSAPEEVRQAVDLLVSEPMSGSYRFNVVLAEHQLPLLDHEPAPSAVSDAFGQVLRAAQAESPEELERIVPDDRYRDVLMRIVRDLAPDGKEVAEIEIARLHSDEPVTVLTAATRAVIGPRLPKRAAKSNDPKTVVLTDTLRVIDLNRQAIRLGPIDHEIRCDVPPGIVLVDVIEGLADRRVRVTGHWKGVRFQVQDIEADTE